MLSPFDSYSHFLKTPGGSLFSPSEVVESSIDLTDRPSRTRTRITPLEKMNDFLSSKDISPVRPPLKIPWEKASERTKRRHIRETDQAVGAVLEEVTPNQFSQLWQSFVKSNPYPRDTEKKGDDFDTALMKDLTECYQNASTWRTRLQILSILADKFTFSALKAWIPELTRYRFSAARKHALLHGRGVLPPQPLQTRMFVAQGQLDHFLDFITSPYVIQDLPFGEKSIKLSTREVIKVPNVIRTLIPESIVKQYLSYAEECGFKPLSCRTLLWILSVCSASERTSLQGLDYISCAGADAFDDLCNVVERLGDEFMGMTWAKEQREQLKAAKRYNKSDFKVIVYTL